MIRKFIEAHDGTKFNHGKFMVCRFDSEEWDLPCVLDLAQRRLTSLLGRCGWTQQHLLVFDIQTGEGAMFRPGGYAKADLDKHAIWVCPMFEPFLTWLYKQDLSDLNALPPIVNLGNVPTSMAGYRRQGPKEGRGKKTDCK